VTLGIGVSAMNINNFTESLATPSVTTQTSNSTFVIFANCTGVVSSFNAPTDNKGNTYSASPQLSAVYNTSGQSGAVWVCSGGTGGSGHIFTAHTSSFLSVGVIAIEITSSGSAGSFGVLDQSGSTSNILNVTTSSTVSITPLVNNEVILSFFALASGTLTVTDPTGYNNILQSMTTGVTGVGGAVGALVQTTAAATNDVFTLSATGSGASLIASFQQNTSNFATIAWVT
jgi:hypothetical protein